MEHSQALDSSFQVIDIHPLIAGTAARDRVAKQIGQACREYGFFFIVGHGVDEELQQRLERLSRQFFAQAIERKLEIRMALGGRAWRGYFPVGGELTSGRPDLLKQDDSGGLQVKSRSGWMAAPPLTGAFLCNNGDMLDRMTGGRYRSTPHRVPSPTQRDRLSFPFFFDPNFNAEVKPIKPGGVVTDDKHERWDRMSVREFSGTYGDYLLRKVSKVFPELGRAALERDD